LDQSFEIPQPKPEVESERKPKPCSEEKKKDLRYILDFLDDKRDEKKKEKISEQFFQVSLATILTENFC
jgi:hypothetical protein